MLRLLIVENSEIYAEALEMALRGLFQIKVCTDGEAALQELLTFQPDALVLNLSLPFKDGLTVLQEAAKLPPVVLVLSLYSNPYAEQSAVKLGAGYVLRMPSVSTVLLRLVDMLRQTYTVQAPQMTVGELLLSLQFKSHLDGYRLLCVGVPLFARDLRQKVTAELYPAIARQCGWTDGRAVEKTIRNAIDGAWRVRDKAVWAKYFPNALEDGVPCPSNKVFITRMAEELNRLGSVAE